jgi:hypothetical protein
MMYVGTGGLLVVVADHLLPDLVPCRWPDDSSGLHRAAWIGNMAALPAWRYIPLIAIGAATPSFGAGIAVAAGASVRSNHSCYLVGEPVRLRGSGFAPARSYIVSIDGVYFGQSQTDTSGGFSAGLIPGGLDAGVAQQTYRLEASDGILNAQTVFTVTRRAGARFLATSGNPNSLRAPFQVWGFALNGPNRAVYLHYVSPSGTAQTTVNLGRTGGQCGYLQTPSRRVFPFTPSLGSWTLQVDTRHAYTSHPGGQVARIGVRIG